MPAGLGGHQFFDSLVVDSAGHTYLALLGPVGRILQEADDRTRTQVIETVRAAFVHGARFTATCWTVSARAAPARAAPKEEERPCSDGNCLFRYCNGMAGYPLG